MKRQMVAEQWDQFARAVLPRGRGERMLTRPGEKIRTVWVERGVVMVLIQRKPTTQELALGIADGLRVVPYSRVSDLGYFGSAFAGMAEVAGPYLIEIVKGWRASDRTSQDRQTERLS